MRVIKLPPVPSVARYLTTNPRYVQYIQDPDQLGTLVGLWPYADFRYRYLTIVL